MKCDGEASRRWKVADKVGKCNKTLKSLLLIS